MPGADPAAQQEYCDKMCILIIPRRAVRGKVKNDQICWLFLEILPRAIQRFKAKNRGKTSRYCCAAARVFGSFCLPERPKTLALGIKTASGDGTESKNIKRALPLVPASAAVCLTSCNLDGKSVLVQTDTTKTKSSHRTLPLVPEFKEKLLEQKARQEEYRRVCGKCYNTEYLEYICVDEMGNLLRPNYVTDTFKRVLEKNGLRPIRFHDLRHSCASLLLANGVPMKQIQEWLGHSDFSTTANIYAHLDYSSKLLSAQAMVQGLKLNSQPKIA